MNLPPRFVPARAGLGTAVAAAVAASLLGFAGASSAQGFRSVYSQDALDVWAVGDGGSVYRSFNGGGSWNTQVVGAVGLNGVVARGFGVWLVGDGGEIRRSTDSGGAWTLTTVPGAPNLHAIEMVNDSVGYVAGAAGTLLKTVDRGLNWTPQTSGTASDLRALRFRDANHGWAVGDGGTALKTEDGGALWTAVPTPTTKSLRAVDFIGSTVWGTGFDGVALKSTTAGASWTALDLKMDSRSDVGAVWMVAPDTVYLAAGGAIRKTVNGGASWTFQQHPMLAGIGDLHFQNGLNGWASNRKNRGVLRTTNGGTTWSLPNATTQLHTWTRKLSALPAETVRGNTLCLSPAESKDVVYGVMGLTVYKSLNRGETWTPVDTIPGGGTRTNAFYVSPKNANHWIAAVQSFPDRITRTLDAGVTWTNTLVRDFTEYGVPLEMHPDKPDTLFFGAEDSLLYRTRNFGATWDTLSRRSPGFRSPCDLVIVPEANQYVYVGDGVTGAGTGKIYQSEDGGVTFALRYTTSGSEIPMMAVTRLDPDAGLATNWSSGGVQRTDDFGKVWTQIITTGSAWGTDFAKDDPNVAVFGTYSGGTSFITTDQGNSFASSSNPNNSANYGYLVIDRGDFLALHGGGIYKMTPTYNYATNNAQSVAVVAPNGGEGWPAGQTRSITWNATNLAIAVVEYRRAPGEPWQEIARVPGYRGTFSWLVPHEPTTQAKIRVRDAWDSAPTDSSNAAFTIQAPAISVMPLALDFGTHPVGSATLDSVRVTNVGTGTLQVTGISTETPAFVRGHAVFSLAPGASDTVGVTFHPTAATAYEDTLTIASNVPGLPIRIPLAGIGDDTPMLALIAPDGGEVWQYGHEHDIVWQSTLVSTVALAYRTGPADPWVAIADSLPAATGNYAWTVPHAPTAEAQVRIAQVGGDALDISAAVFQITAPQFAAAPDPLNMTAVVGASVTDTLRIENSGTAPLTVTAVTVNDAEFTPGRTAFTIPAGEADTLGITYAPAEVGADTAVVTLTTDDIGSPHSVTVIGQGQEPVAVESAPLAFSLMPARPNPFTETTWIRYAVPEASDVTIEVFDVQGQRVASLVRARQEPGVYSVPFRPAVGNQAGHSGGRLGSGVYFCRMQAGRFARTQKILLMR